MPLCSGVATASVPPDHHPIPITFIQLDVSFSLPFTSRALGEFIFSLKPPISLNQVLMLQASMTSLLMLMFSGV